MRNRVRELRHCKGWTIWELSKASGVQIGYISEIERGLKVPGVVVASRLARALGVTIEELFPDLTTNIPATESTC